MHLRGTWTQAGAAMPQHSPTPTSQAWRDPRPSPPHRAPGAGAGRAHLLLQDLHALALLEAQVRVVRRFIVVESQDRAVVRACRARRAPVRGARRPPALPGPFSGGSACCCWMGPSAQRWSAPPTYVPASWAHASSPQRGKLHPSTSFYNSPGPSVPSEEHKTKSKRSPPRHAQGGAGPDAQQFQGFCRTGPLGLAGPRDAPALHRTDGIPCARD